MNHDRRLLRCAFGSIAALLALAVPGLPVTAAHAATCTNSWAQYQVGPAHDGVNRCERSLGTSNVASLHEHWVDTNRFGNSDTQVVESNSRVFYLDATGRLNARNASSGANLWSTKLDPGMFSEPVSTPAVAAGVVYAGGNSLDLYAVNESTGAHKWQTQLAGGNGVNSLAVMGSTVYATAETTVYALNATNGHILWSQPASDAFAQVFAPPALGNGAVYVTSNVVAAYNATSGALLWKDVLPGSGYTEGAAVMANHLVYVTSSVGTMALNPSNGHVVWSSSITATQAGPAVDGSTLVESSNNGTLYAVNAISGAPLWHVAGDGGGAAVPAIANGVVYISGFNGAASTFVPLRGLNEATGSLLWSNASSVSCGFGGPSEANGTVYLGTTSGIFAFGL